MSYVLTFLLGMACALGLVRLITTWLQDEPYL